MSQFEKNQIKRQSIAQQLPLRLANYLDYQQHLIKDSFTTKSRYILPKSEQKIFSVDQQFVAAFTQLTLDEKVAYYSKQITFLKQIVELNGVEFDSVDGAAGSVEIKAKVKGKGLGNQKQEMVVKVHTQTSILEIPHKLGVYKPELHSYLLRQGMGEDGPQIVLDAIRPNIVKFWKFTFQTEEENVKMFKALTVAVDRALRKKLQDEVRAFQQSKIMSKSTLKKRSQMEIPGRQHFLQSSKFGSQVFENNVAGNKQKRAVNFERESNVVLLSQHRDDTSIIDALSTQFRAISPPIDYERPAPQNLFDTDEDWFLKLMSEGYVCSELYDGIEPDVVLSNNTNFKTIYQKSSNKLLQNNKDPRCFKLFARLSCPKDLILSAFCEIDKWALWNKAVQQASVKLRVPASNMLVCKMKMRQLSFKYRPREFVFMMHFFNKNGQWYLMITSVKEAYHPVTEDDTIRAKISRCLVRLKESNGTTTLEMLIDIKQQGELNQIQQIQLSQKFLLGIFDLEGFLKDRVFVEAKASKYFDLKWSNEKFSRFTLGKNNDLDETESFTSNLCSEICSFYSAEGPEDYEGIGQFTSPPNIMFTTEERQYSFKKKGSSHLEKKVGQTPPLQVSRGNKTSNVNINSNTLPFDIPIRDNKIVLDELTKQRLEAYIREKQENRIRKLEYGNFNQIIGEKRPQLIQKYSSKTSLPLPLPPIIETHSKRHSEDRISQEQISSYVEMKQDLSNKVLKPIPIITKQPSVAEISIRKSSFSNIRGSAHQSNIYTSQAQDYDILPMTKKMVSKIQIDKHNPDDHIVSQWEPKVYPDSGLVILSDEYIEKWVSMQPINPKKIRPYKGDTWDHFLFRDLWTVTQTGEMKCVNQQKLSAQSSAIKLVLKRFASNVMSGKGILNVSLPVQIFSELSLCFAPHFLEKAAQSDNPVERFKMANAFSLSASLLYIEMEKPFNPILGETYQGWIGGSPVYCEQISHHPPISAFYLVGRGYTVSGRLQPTIDLSLNSGVGWNEGEFSIKFANYPNFVIRTQSPPGQITGLAYGDRKLTFTGKSYSYDNNGLFCQFIFNPTKKGMLSFGKQQKQSDYMKGAIVRVDPSFIKKYTSASAKKRQAPSNKEIIQKVCEAEGRWTVGLSFGGVEYFNIAKDIPNMLEQQKYPLNSHCNYREDIHFRRCLNYELAQSHKERLQVLQRNDKKLRSKDGH